MFQHHFRAQHFLCEEAECLDKKWVVFPTDPDLKVPSTPHTKTAPGSALRAHWEGTGVT